MYIEIKKNDFMDFVGLAYDSQQYFPNENPTRKKKHIFIESNYM